MKKIKICSFRLPENINKINRKKIEGYIFKLLDYSKFLLMYFKRSLAFCPKYKNTAKILVLQ